MKVEEMRSTDPVQLLSGEVVMWGSAFVYCLNGPRIELVTRAVLPMFEQYWRDGRNPFA
jgi:hypothetical protein